MAQSSLLYGAGVLTASGLAAQLLGFLYRVMLSRTVGAEAMGVFHLAMSAYGFMLSACLSGLSASSLRLSAQFAALGDADRGRALVRKLLTVFFCLCAACGAAVFLFSDGISASLLKNADAGLAVVCAVPVLMLTGVENILKNHFMGVGRVAPGALSEVAETAVRMLAVFALLRLLRPGSAAMRAACVVLGMGVSEVFSACVLGAVYCRTYRGAAHRTCAGLGKQAAAVAVPVALTNSAASALSAANSALLIAGLTSAGMEQSRAAEALGSVFGMALPLVTFPMAMLDGLARMLMPDLAGRMAVGDMAAVRRKISKAFLAVCLYAAPAAALMIPLGPTLAGMLYGGGEAGRYMAPLCVCAAVGAVKGISSSVMHALGLQNRAAAYYILGGFIQLAFTRFGAGARGLGVMAAIAGMGASGIVTLALEMAAIVRATGVRIRAVSWFLCPGAASCAAAVAARRCFAALNDLPQWSALACSAAAGVLVYIILLRAMGIKHTQLFYFTEAAAGKHRQSREDAARS